MRKDLEKFYRKLDNFDLYKLGSHASLHRTIEFIDILSRYRNLFGNEALDIGCGGGVSTFALEKLGLNVIGIDPQEEMIKVARETAKKIGSKAEFLLGDIFSVSIDKRLDSLFMLGNVLAHISVSEFRNMVREFEKLLRSNGVLVIHYADTIADILNGELFIKSPGTARNDVEFSYDIEDGSINITIIERKIRDDLYEADRFRIHIWAPWILETVMDSNFTLIARDYLPRNMILDIYKIKK